VACVAVVVFNTWASWSSVVVGWFSRGDDDTGETWVPRFVLWMLQNRPDVGDADIHLIMWFVAGVVITGAVYGRRRWGWWVVAVWGWSLLLEVLQPVVSTVRGREWIDAVGNTMGIALGAALVLWWRTRRNAAG
jgi:hypothetical protein